MPFVDSFQCQETINYLVNTLASVMVTHVLNPVTFVHPSWCCCVDFLFLSLIWPEPSLTSYERSRIYVSTAASSCLIKEALIHFHLRRRDHRRHQTFPKKNNHQHEYFFAFTIGSTISRQLRIILW